MAQARPSITPTLQNEVPERWETLKANPDLIETAIEESLRHDPPVLAHFRTQLQ